MILPRTALGPSHRNHTPSASPRASYRGVCPLNLVNFKNF
jgi:hypothetical protein